MTACNFSIMLVKVCPFLQFGKRSLQMAVLLQLRKIIGLLLGAVTSALSGAVMLLGGIAARMRCVKTCLVFSAASLALAVVAKILGFSGALLLIISSIINAILAYFQKWGDLKIAIVVLINYKKTGSMIYVRMVLGIYH